MDPFRRLAVFTLARDASFVALAASTLMFAFSFAPALAFAIGANIALIFSLFLLLRAARLSEERVARTEVWRVLEKKERPPGAAGRRWACDHLQELLLHFAKGAAGIAIALQSSALLASFGQQAGAGHTILTASLN